MDGEPLAVNFDTTRNSDEYCLDGQRLIHQAGSRGTNGAEYRLELEAFTRVILRDRDGLHGPDYFVVQRRDGSTSYYGDYDGCGAPTAGAACSFSGLANRPDARANANNDGLSRPEGQIFGLSRSYDSHGNYMDWQWTSPSASAVELLPGTVRYTGRANHLPGMNGPIRQPYAEVRYLYEASPVLRKAYQGGSLSQLTRRLATIQSVDASNQVIREYRLSYQVAPSGNLDYQVSQITECAINGVQATCLKPTIFTWSTATYDFVEGETRTDPTWQRMIDSKIGDINGDGRLDLVWIGTSAAGGNSCPTLPNNHFCARVSIAFGSTDGSGRFRFLESLATSFFRAWPGNASDYSKVSNRWALVDYNGDGRDDLMLHPSGTSNVAATLNWELFLSNSFGFDANDRLANSPMPTQISDLGASSALAIEPNLQLSDLNGDGLVDVVYGIPVRTSNPNQIATSIQVRLGRVDAEAASFGPALTASFAVESGPNEACWARADLKRARLTDVNADGRMDWPLAYVCEIFPAPTRRVHRQEVLPLLTDEAMAGQPGNVVLRPALMTGGSVEGDNYVFHHYLVAENPSPKWIQLTDSSQFADVNGDGLPDLIWHRDSTAEVWINTGSAAKG
ncbi:MAG: VCBS repeat-containing protein, partial [Xanthomonadales bacterium]|nr:VCBS repeat-containing protein [Xanthomonadales bacterium]